MYNTTGISVTNGYFKESTRQYLRASHQWTGICDLTIFDRPPFNPKSNQLTFVHKFIKIVNLVKFPLAVYKLS